MRHLTRAVLFASILAAPAVAAAAGRVRTGVVVVGPDGPATGALQAGLEAALVAELQDHFVVVPAAEVGPRVGTRTANESDTRAAVLIDEGRRLFYEGKPAESLERLTRAATLSGAPARDRIRAHLYRATVFQAAGDIPGMDDALLEVLRLDPAHELSLDEFPPALRDPLESLRRVTKTFTVRVAGVLPGAEAFLDDRPLGADRSIQAAAGDHELSVRAPGFRRVRADLTVSGDTDAVAPPLPLAFGTAQESALAALAARRAVSDPQLAEKLATAAKVDALVVVSLFGASTEALVTRGDRSEGRSFAGPDAAAIASWAAGALRRVRPTEGGPLAGPQRTLSAGWAVLGWQRTVRGSGAGSDPVSLEMGGTGAHASGLLSGERFGASFDVLAASFAMSQVEATLPGSGRATGTGGGYLRGAARGGYGAVRSGPLDVWLWAGIDAERYGSPEPLASTGLPLFVSWAAVAPVAGAEAQWRPLPSLEGGAALFLAGGGAYVEQPSGATGTRPDFALSPSARVSVRWAASSRWRVDAGWSIERREVRFHGRTDTAFEEPIADARLVDLRQTFSIAAGRSF